MPHGGEGRAQMRWKHAELDLLRKWLKGVSHNPSQKEITRQLEKWQMSGELRAGWTYAKLRSKCTVEAQSAATPLAGKLLQQEPTFTWASAGAARQKALAATFKLSKRGLGSLFAKLEVGAVSQGGPAGGAAAGEAAALGLVGAGAARRGGATAASASPAGEPVPAPTSAPPAVAEGHKLTCDRCKATTASLDGRSKGAPGIRGGVPTPVPTVDSFERKEGRGTVATCATCRRGRAAERSRQSERRHRQSSTALNTHASSLEALAWAAFGHAGADRVSRAQSASEWLAGRGVHREPTELLRLFRRIGNSARLDSHRQRQERLAAERLEAQYLGGGGVLPIQFLRPCIAEGARAKAARRSMGRPRLDKERVLTWQTQEILPWLGGEDLWVVYAPLCVCSNRIALHAWARCRVGCRGWPDFCQCCEDCGIGTRVRGKRRPEEDHEGPRGSRPTSDVQVVRRAIWGWG